MEQKKMGFWGLMSMGVGVVIGAGVFTTMTVVISQIGRAMPVAMMAGVVLALLQMVPTIIISSMVTTRGGMYAIYQMLFPENVAGVLTIIGSISYVSCAGMAVGLASYTLQLIVPDASPMVSQMVAVAYVALMYLINMRGMNASTMVQNFMVVILIVAMGTYVFGGMPHVQPGYFSGDDFFLGGFSGFIAATSILTMSAQGASLLINFASDAKNPKRDIPLAMLFSTVLVGILYFFVAMVTAGVLPVEEVAGKNLGVIADTFMSQPIYLLFMVGGAIFALLTTMNTNIAASAAPWVTMAEDGWLPSFLAKKTKSGYPWVVRLILFSLGAVVPIFLGWDVANVSSFFMLPGVATSVAVYISALTLPKRYPELWAKSDFKVPMPVYYVLILLGLATAMFLTVGYLAYITPASLVVMAIIMAILIGFATYRYKKGLVKSTKAELIGD
jgi:APA family basic amino acid/polyamine antiporter